jgi:hypothetical protein
VKAVIETKEPVKEPVKKKLFRKKSKSRGDLQRSDYYSVSKIVGN